MNGGFEHAIIRGFERAEELSQQNNPLEQFSAMFNPENFNILNTFNFDSAQSDGETGSEQKFRSVGPRTFKFDFEIDATGAADVIQDVDEQIDKFKRATGFKRVGGFSSNERRPTFLSLTWGTFSIRCILQDMEVEYTLFDDDGKPLRAIIKAKFGEYKTLLRQIRENPAFEQIATQVRSAAQIITEGQGLDTLAQKIYGSTSSLIDVARANGLDSLRNIANLPDLELPPIDQLREQAATIAQSSIAQAQELANQSLAEAQQAAEEAMNQAQNLVQGGTAQAQILVQRNLEAATNLADQAITTGLEDVGGAIDETISGFGLSNFFS